MDRETADILERGWNLLNGGDRDGAEQLFVLASERAPDDADPWNGLGAVSFEAGDLAASLEYYVKARDIELQKRGGAWPPHMDWHGEDKAALKALHGVARNLLRMGRAKDAEGALKQLLRLDPDDAQGARFLLEDIKKGRSPWNDEGSRDDA